MPVPLDREQQYRRMRQAALDIFHHALRESSIEKAFDRKLDCERGVLRICDDLYDLHAYTRVLVVSIGKAGQTMVQALQAKLGGNVEGIVVCPEQPRPQSRGFRYFLGGHPTPNEESIRAADGLLKSLAAQNASSLIIYLLSGGGSSMVEKPVDDDISLEDTARELDVDADAYVRLFAPFLRQPHALLADLLGPMGHDALRPQHDEGGQSRSEVQGAGHRGPRHRVLCDRRHRERQHLQLRLRLRDP